MVLMAADDADHRASKGKAKAKAKPALAASLPPAAAAAPPATKRTRLHDFTFPPTLSWGTHRLLRCSKDGDASAPAPSSPPAHPHTPSPHKEKQPHQGAAPPRPWNLRARRSATAAPGSEGAGKAAAWQAQQPLASPPPSDARKKVGFSAALTKEEIAEDFLAIAGARPPRRPRKRPRAVQRQIDMLYPGSSLADVTLDSYKIEER
ncbi:hypothetical protein PR202_gb02032 [Eleusine coracana subsp. coracana]|uniref:Uncharacterized protein n=1 Tax=Eleusine coracana subsp. coracana TaxID=191504 RepID=A0AAV5DY94_ELECO|nr:hypothetical protein QOZ80_5BG0412230 [Eleusine coracana subsp. coracana]GJN15139.1 hypothetical protein PR202_gb02032 [Eleusine coracana subsp. coracana]